MCRDLRCAAVTLLSGLPAPRGIAGLTWWLRPEEVLRFPRVRPGIWALVMLLYPILLAYPQELIYRTCFFRRYAPIFPSATAMLLASSIAFAWLHIVFWNVPALVLSLLGGVALSHTYQRSHSTLAVTSNTHATVVRCSPLVWGATATCRASGWLTAVRRGRQDQSGLSPR